MNQILETKNKSKKLIKFFKIQFIFSFIMIIVLFGYILYNYKIKIKEKGMSNIINMNAKLVTVFDDKDNEDSSLYFGKLNIPKINLEYFIFNGYSDELLKILPCKFSGGLLKEKGNICIIGHNYFDDRFFGNLDKLKINDEIILENLKGDKYKYIIYDIYQIDARAIDTITSSDGYNKTVTLCTCTLDKNKRLIIKAKF